MRVVDTNFGALWQNKCCRFSTISVFVIGILLTVILVPISFHDIEYNEYGFPRNTISQHINWDVVYEAGYWMWGPGFTAFIFPRSLIKVELRYLSIIPNNGLPMNINVEFYYHLDKDRIHDLFNSFGSMGFYSQAERLAISAIKNAAPILSVDDFITNREHVEDVFEFALRDVLYQNFLIVDQGHFFLMEVILPESILEKNLQTAIQAQKAMTANFTQQQVLISQETAYLCSLYTNNASYINSTTAAEVDKIITNAYSTADKLQEQASGEGLQYFLNVFPLTKQENIKLVNEILAYINKQPNIVVGNLTPFIQLAPH